MEVLINKNNINYINRFDEEEVFFFPISLYDKSENNNELFEFLAKTEQGILLYSCIWKENFIKEIREYKNKKREFWELVTIQDLHLKTLKILFEEFNRAFYSEWDRFRMNNPLDDFTVNNDLLNDEYKIQFLFERFNLIVDFTDNFSIDVRNFDWNKYLKDKELLETITDDSWVRIVRVENWKILLSSRIEIFFKWTGDPKNIYFKSNADWKFLLKSLNSDFITHSKDWAIFEENELFLF